MEFVHLLLYLVSLKFLLRKPTRHRLPLHIGMSFSKQRALSACPGFVFVCTRRSLFVEATHSKLLNQHTHTTRRLTASSLLVSTKQKIIKTFLIHQTNTKRFALEDLLVYQLNTHPEFTFFLLYKTSLFCSPCRKSIRGGRLIIN